MLIVIKLFAKDQSDLDSPELGSPMSSSSELEEEREESELDVESLLGADTSWSVQKKCGTCFLCHIICPLPFLPSPSILEAKIEDRVSMSSCFARGYGWTGVLKNALMGPEDMVFATEGRKDTVE